MSSLPLSPPPEEERRGHTPMSQYDEFAENYHWLYSDYALSGKPALQQNETF